MPPTSTAEPSPTPIPQLGSTRTDSKGIEQVWVPAGKFVIGMPLDNDLNVPKFAGNELQGEMPAHEVEITQGFWIDKYEVTNASFQQFIDDDGYTTEAYWSDAGWKWLQSQAKGRFPVECPEKRPEHPRACVTWFEAEAYAKWRGGQLPTEAQWEYAARGHESLIYPWGNEFDETQSNLVKAIGTKPVGSFPDGASWVGAHDLAGNVMEWVQDWYSLTYRSEQVKVDPPGPTKGNIKIEKGGWWGGPSPSYIARAAYRHFEDPPGYQDDHIGFRIVTIKP